MSASRKGIVFLLSLFLSQFMLTSSERFVVFVSFLFLRFLCSCVFVSIGLWTLHFDPNSERIYDS